MKKAEIAVKESKNLVVNTEMTEHVESAFKLMDGASMNLAEACHEFYKASQAVGKKSDLIKYVQSQRDISRTTATQMISAGEVIDKNPELLSLGYSYRDCYMLYRTFGPDRANEVLKNDSPVFGLRGALLEEKLKELFPKQKKLPSGKETESGVTSDTSRGTKESAESPADNNSSAGDSNDSASYAVSVADIDALYNIVRKLQEIKQLSKSSKEELMVARTILESYIIK